MAWDGKMASPVKGRVSCEWREYAGHAGIDIACSVGTPVYAAYAGTVEKAAWACVSGRSGYGVVVRNSDGEAQYYGHLSKIQVKVGQKVSCGQQVALSGATGNVTGPHLHFETWKSGGTGGVNQDVNPRLHFAAHEVQPGSTTGQGTAATSAATPNNTLYKGVIDGKFQEKTIKSLQQWLRRRGYYVAAIDGVMGVETWKGVQRWLAKDGYYDRAGDGSAGPFTILGVQKALKKAGYYTGLLDGDFGEMTRKAWQTYLSKHV